MVCYARPVGRLTALVLILALILYRPLDHSLAAAGLVVALTAGLAVAAVAAVLAVAGVMSVRHRRAAAGGCVNCRFRCQHAMTGPSGRRWLVTMVDRGQPEPISRPAAAAPAPAPVFLAMPAIPRQRQAEPAQQVSRAGPAQPRWPDRPARR